MKHLAMVLGLALVVLVGCGASAPAPAQSPGTYPPGLTKFDMPDGLPAVYTWCVHGTRVFMSYTRDGGSSGRPSPALASSPGCLE